MEWLSVLVFSCAANIDNLVVGFSYGVKGVRIPVLSNILIAVLSGVGTFLSMTAGKWLSACLPAAVCHLAGGLMLVGMGGWTCWQALKGRKKEDGKQGIMQNPEQADKDKSGHIQPSEAILLGGALVLNNLGMGVGASVLGLPVTAAACFSAVLSFVFMTAGGYLGKRLSGKLRHALVLSGLCIIALGLYGCFGG